MNTPLLATKLQVPFLRPDIVPRGRLFEKLDKGLRGKLILVSAPAGFGKSTLISQYTSLCEWPVTWISLGKEDNDPIRFMSYFIAALQDVDSDIGMGVSGLLQTNPPTDIQLILTGLINDITEIPHHFVLALDDYHVITNPKIQEIMFFLLENQPTQLHIIISTRVYPPWPLARLRARGEMIEIGTQDLRFSPIEVATFLNDIRGLELSSESLDALEARTEGWIAGLQMAAISLQGKEDVVSFIEEFTGNHRYVMDFLIEEILHQQSPDVKDFLIKTSILESLNSELCDFVLVQEDSQLKLNYLTQANLFLIPLDDQRQWFRYHHLFADLLQNILHADCPGCKSALHLKASRWYAERGDFSPAIEHALAASDLDLAADIIETNTISFIGNNAMPLSEKILVSFPDSMYISRPWLAISKAWAFAYSGESELARECLELVKNAKPQIVNTRKAKHIKGQVAAVECYLALYDAEFAISAENGYQALSDLPETDYQTRILTAATMASALRLDGRLSEAHQVLNNATELAEKQKNDATVVQLLCTLALLHITQARLRNAISVLEKAVQITKRYDQGKKQKNSPFLGQIYIRLADIYSRMNELDQALIYLNNGIDLASQWGQANVLWQGYSLQALLLHGKGDFEGSKTAEQETKRIAKQMSAKLTEDATAVLQAEIWRDEENFTALGNWLEERNIRVDNKNIHFSQIDDYEFLVETLLARGKGKDALTVLSNTLKVVEDADATAIVISHLIYTARAHQALGQSTKAQNSLVQALKLGQDTEFISVFIHHCDQMTDILRKILIMGIGVDFIQEILSSIEQQNRSQLKIQSIEQGLIDPLSERELEVLRMLVTELNSLEIADELIISVNTVRSHIKNIYSKLGVNSRFEAVSKAKEIGLL